MPPQAEPPIAEPPEGLVGGFPGIPEPPPGEPAAGGQPPAPSGAPEDPGGPADPGGQAPPGDPGEAPTEVTAAGADAGAAGAAAASAARTARLRRPRLQTPRLTRPAAARRPALPARRPRRAVRTADAGPAAPRALRPARLRGVEVAGLSQVSPALAVLLLAVVIFVLLWLIVLRPGSSTTSTSASLPAATQPAVVTTTTTPGSTQRVVPGRGHVVHRSGSGRGVPQPATANGRIISALAAHRVVALLVSNPGGADDDAVRTELGALRFPPAQVLKLAVPTSQLAQIPVITASVSINQTPTFVIIDRSRTVTTIVGFADSFELSTRVAQALATHVSNAPLPTIRKRSAKKHPVVRKHRGKKHARR